MDLEEAFRELPCSCEATREMMLTLLDEYIRTVDTTAEKDVLSGNPLEGAHYRAMGKVAADFRQRINLLR